MAISRAEFDTAIDNLNLQITSLQSALANSIPTVVETRLAVIETKLQENEPMLLQRVQQLAQSEQARFAIETRLGMTDQWRKTVDEAPEYRCWKTPSPTSKLSQSLAETVKAKQPGR